MGTLTHKGYGRIYCETVDDIAKVHDVIKELDEYEFGYMPKGIVTTFNEYPNVVYTGKFSDMGMDTLTAVCWSKGIKFWVFDAGRNDLPVSEIPVHEF